MTIVEITYRYEARATPAKPLPLNSRAALLRLDEGNRDFAALLDHVKNESGVVQQVIPVDPRDLGLLPDEAGTLKQRPFAAILGCSDARVPVELIFNEGPNDLFVIRVAGNGLGTEVLGSLRYAVEHLGGTLKLVVVLGHSGCGALTTAVDIFLHPGDYLGFATQHSLRSILDRLQVVVQATSRKMLETFGPDIALSPGYRTALIEASIVTNAALAAYSIRQEFETNEITELRAAYGVYLVDSRQVWVPRPGDMKGAGLAEPPRDLVEFSALGDAIVRSDRIASLLRAEK